jgi:hypothetical protein
VQFKTLLARNCCKFLILLNSKSKRHSVRLIIPLWEMEMCWILWSIRISDSHMSQSLDILDSDLLPIVFHILDHVSTKITLGTNRQIYRLRRFQSLALNLISPTIEINSGTEANKWHATLQLLLLWRISYRPVRSLCQN